MINVLTVIIKCIEKSVLLIIMILNMQIVRVYAINQNSILSKYKAK